MAKQSALTELLERNPELFTGKRVLFAGEILDESLLQLVRETSRAALIVDNYAIAAQMAALFAKELPSAPPATVTYKQVSVHFAATEDALNALKAEEPFDVLCLSVHKSKAVSQSLLHDFSALLTDGATIAVAGANDGGGRSAHQLLKNCADVYKKDTARKCTLFCGTYHRESPFASPAGVQDLTLSFSVKDDHLRINTEDADSRTLDLAQNVAVFSPAALDKGTALLIESAALADIRGKSLLDLCCGCGVVGMSLAPFAGAVTYCDVSAEALSLTARNLQALGLEGTVRAASFLEGMGKYDVIVVNPPFHQGVNVAISPTITMLKSLKEHLNTKGCAYVVYNRHLNYAAALEEGYTVSKVAEKKGFTVIRVSV